MKKQYAYQSPPEWALSKMEEIREAYSKVHLLLEEYIPSTRERAVALTDLENSCMWAIKAYAFAAAEKEEMVAKK